MPYWFDGNNLIGQSAAAAKANPKIRQAFLATLSSYHSSRGGKFVVYFDGDDPGGSLSHPGVGIRFSAPLSTDDAILRRIKEIQHPTEVIVVTNDRELMAMSRDAGAAAIGWSEFESRMKAGSSRGRRKTEPQDIIDVEDWIKYFGLDKTDI
jgi:predicted RNA-binding protein with PIN domain